MPSPKDLAKRSHEVWLKAIAFGGTAAGLIIGAIAFFKDPKPETILPYLVAVGVLFVMLADEAKTKKKHAEEMEFLRADCNSRIDQLNAQIKTLKKAEADRRAGVMTRLRSLEADFIDFDKPNQERHDNESRVADY